MILSFETIPVRYVCLGWGEVCLNCTLGPWTILSPSLLLARCFILLQNPSWGRWEAGRQEFLNSTGPFGHNSSAVHHSCTLPRSPCTIQSILLKERFLPLDALAPLSSQFFHDLTTSKTTEVLKNFLAVKKGENHEGHCPYHIHTCASVVPTMPYLGTKILTTTIHFTASVDPPTCHTSLDQYADNVFTDRLWACWSS